jgi:hypothetical protein
MTEISKFDPGIHNIIPVTPITVLVGLSIVKHTELKQLTSDFRNITDAKLKALFKKNKFPFVTWSGVFSKRADKNLIKHSGVIGIDVDKLTPHQFLQITTLLKNLEDKLAGYYVSPTGNGYKILIRVNTEHEHTDNYKACVNFLSDKLQMPRDNFDMKCSNVSRACFLCHDPNVYIHPSLLKTGDITGIEVIDTKAWLGEELLNTDVSQTKLERESVTTELPFDNIYLRGGKLDFKHKDNKQNFWLLYNINVQRHGVYKIGNRNRFIQTFASLANLFGMSLKAFLEYAILLVEDFNSKVSDDELFNIDDELIPTINYTYEHYKDKFNTWEDESENQYETPLIPEEVFENLPGFLKIATKKFQSSRERDVFFVGALGVLSNMFPRVEGLYAQRWLGANLMFFISAPAASGKGTLHWAWKLGSRLSKKLKDKYASELKQYEEDLEFYEAAKKNGEQVDKPIKPKKQKFFIAANNSTASFINILFNNEYQGLLFETEAESLQSSMQNLWGNYSDILRRCYHHEPITLQRKLNDEDIEIDRPKLSVVLSGTPAQIDLLLSSIENGFFSRILFYDFRGNAKFKNVFLKEIEPKEEYFEGLAVWLELMSQPYFMSINEDGSNRIRFLFTEDQEKRFHAWFEIKLVELNHLYGDDILASVVRLAVCYFRIAMILSILRNIEVHNQDLKHLSEQTHIVCADIDYDNTEKIISSLLLHTTKIFRQVKKHSRNKFGKNIKATFLEKLPQEFDRQTAIDLAALIGIREKTAEKYLSDFVRQNSITKPQHNHYVKA